jgi:hypothetical protein
MKKIYLIILLSVIYVGVQAQGLTASNVFITGDPTFFLEAHATITNTGNVAKDVTVQRTVNNLFAGHSSYFCWVQCYSAQTSLAPDNVSLNPGDNTDIFRGDLETNAISGISVVTYCFFDINNISDSVCVEYIYDATTGLTDIPAGKNFISKAFPNPASDFTQFYVNINKGVKNAQVKIYNMLGAEVKSVPVTEAKNNLKINVSDLKGGIYFYSLFIDGKSTSTGKLMVSKN